MKLTRDYLVCHIENLVSLRDRRPFRLSVDFWAEAAVLAAARLLSNHDKRAESADRADNEGIDLMGAASELLLYLLLERFAGCCPLDPQTGTLAARASLDTGLANMRRGMFIQGGGAEAKFPDLSFGAEGSPDAIDAKSFDFQPNHGRFMINGKKHRDLRSCRPTYFCFLAPRFSDSAHVAIVPYEHVSKWGLKRFVFSPKKPKARHVLMHVFARDYMQTTFSALISASGRIHATGDIKASATSTAKGRGLALARMPQLERQILDSRFEKALRAVLDGVTFEP